MSNIKAEIIEKLHQIEEKEKVQILLAVESGSRAWGFASPDSDYDVRFIYKRPQKEYLRLDKKRDVIELPIDSVFDINGWDLDKTLKLLYQSNPTLFEWFSSPIIYLETDFAPKFRNIMNQYFSSKKGLYHYLSMAKNNYREYLRTDFVKAKKYFYVLRPILACQWILEKNSPPPMLFSELVSAEAEDKIKPYIQQLFEIKINSPEIKLIPKISALNFYIEQNFEKIPMQIKNIQEDFSSWEKLNQLFLEEIQ